ncbi:helix-turn-helix domain-containing protein [Pseudalkalibacillus berkeleyi]|uniref:Helix-turn-helix domain-containing protein n=1 Tax=Pseudalkalibacillus berkeleyi TaxID=1069813 RepID=A0ABS9GY31_9BACL|nr:helix-turn-helix transcriptional regulator [Pseudalkalibacillus berkeleyi]MCF6136661.1 helix-turn-helix domain-containing protein [Pseudalkalibacillus berkeleyi]
MIGEKILYYRRIRNFTQDELADGICSISYLSKVENNKLEPSKEILNLLMERLEVVLMIEDEVSIDKLRRELFEWYNTLRSGDIEDSKIQKKYLKQKIQTFDSIDLKLYYSIFNLKYWLVQQNTKKAEEILDELDSVRNLFSNTMNYYYLYGLGIYYYLTHKYRLSLKYFNQALDYQESNIEKDFLNYHLALVHSQLFHVTFAKTYAEEALTLFSKAGNVERSIDCQIIIGINNNRLSNFDEAEHQFRNALLLADRLNLEMKKAYIFHNIGYINSVQKRHDAAIVNYKRSLSIKQKYEIKNYLNTIYHIANEYKQLNKHVIAIEWIKRGLEFGIEFDLKDFIKLKILQYQITENPILVDYLEKEAIPYFYENHDWVNLCECSEILANYYKEKKQYKKSSYYFSEANELRKNNII